MAALFADAFAGIAAMLAVMVVPMFSPNIIAAAISNGIHPFVHIINVMATVALDDWTMTVRRLPIPRKISREVYPMEV